LRLEESHEFLRLSGSRPSNFEGSLKLPPSKSYLHRALFVSSLCSTESRIEDVGRSFSEDVTASINALEAFGMAIQKITRNSDTNLLVHPKAVSSSRREIFAGGSGATARFAIAFAAIPSDGGNSIISGNTSLLKRPMQPLINALTQIGASCYSKNSNGRLPVVVKANGIEGGSCRIDGYISSQFISALLIACTQARKDTLVEIENPSQAVSIPYIRATQFVLDFYGFKIKLKRSPVSLSFLIKGNQTGLKGRKFSVPGDMSSAAALIGATLAAKGRVGLNGVNLQMPQADLVFLNIAKKFGATISRKGRSLVVSALEEKDGNKRWRSLTFDLKDSPDIVPIVAGVAAALGRAVKIRNVSHLRFKESDRLSALSKELRKIGMRTVENQDSLSISSRRNIEPVSRNNPTILSSENDHRILMGLTIAGISGRFGEVLISNPSCVSKSYPSFVDDLKSLAHNENILSIVKKG
jgi:3-phosphoshikimate 1-carboxyvinyltransferase